MSSSTSPAFYSATPNFQPILRDSRYTDFTIKCIDNDGTTHLYPIFSGLLHVQSGYFRQFFDSHGQWKESTQKEHAFTEETIPGGSKVLFAILDYLHGGCDTPMKRTDIDRVQLVTVMDFLQVDILNCVHGFLRSEQWAASFNWHLPPCHAWMHRTEHLIRSVFSCGSVPVCLIPRQEDVANAFEVGRLQSWVFDKIGPILSEFYPTTDTDSRKNILRIMAAIHNGSSECSTFVASIFSHGATEEMADAEFAMLKKCGIPDSERMRLVGQRVAELCLQGHARFGTPEFWREQFPDKATTQRRLEFTPVRAIPASPTLSYTVDSESDESSPSPSPPATPRAASPPIVPPASPKRGRRLIAASDSEDGDDSDGEPAAKTRRLFNYTPL